MLARVKTAAGHDRFRPAAILAAMSFWSATRCRFHIALRHPTDRAVLLVDDRPGWALPVVEAEPGHPGDFRAIARTMRERLGLDVAALGCLAHEFDPTARLGESVREVESQSPDWTPRPPARWVTTEELATLALTTPRHRTLLTSWLSGRKQSPLPWERRGWLQRAVGWCDAELRARGLASVERVEQVRQWEFSTVLRLTTADRRFFFKAVPQGREREVRLTQRLAERHPGSVAQVLASDLEQTWMLMAEIGGVNLEEVRDLRRWEAAAATYARLQTDWIGRGDELVALGCRDLSLPNLAAAIVPCIGDTAALAPGLRRDLSAEEIHRLRALGPALAAACKELEGFGIPATLDHADLWASNVIDGPHGPVIIDWEDAGLSHPFFALWHLILSAEDRVDDTVNAPARIRDAYLEPWTRYESPKRLREAFDLAQRLAPLCYAITFRLDVLPVLDASWELREFVPFFLRRLLGAWR
jgi:hypothetical protein